MKKILFILITLFLCNNVYAKESFYYDSERVEEMWITKVNSEEVRVAHPYLIKRTSDNAYVFCLEPFTLLQNKVEYSNINDYKKYGLSESQYNRIMLILYYGYGYKNHTSDIWYGVTQYLVWKEADKSASIYFAKNQNGEKANLYTKEINEIEELIKNHSIEPNFIKDYKVSIEEDLIVDSNIDLSEYNIIANVDYKLENNRILFSNLEKGNYNIKLERKNNRFNSNVIMYYNSSSQNIIVAGNDKVYEKSYEFNIEVVEGSIKLIKKNRNDEVLDGATYGIYKDGNLIKKVDTEVGLVVNLPIGKYEVKELVAPAGYKLDSKTYEFDLSLDDNSKELVLYDDKIIVKIPDTGRNNYSYYLIGIGLIGLLCSKKVLSV